MEFLTANLINTTTQIAVNSNTSTVSNLFNTDPYYQYYSENMANDLTTSSIIITFDETTSVSRIALKDTNAKEFRLFYNGATANSITFLNGATTTSSFTSNSETSLYFRFSTIAVSSITLEIKKTITADQEKYISELVISDLHVTLDKIPDASGYKPRIIPKQVVHKLSDGGTRIHNVRKKYNTSINLDYISESQRDSLKDLYETNDSFMFCPFGTSTGWDGILYAAVWPGEFDFYEYTDNAASSGFSGKISILETPS